MNKVYKTILSAAAVSMVAGAIIAPQAVNAWGDSAHGRAIYTNAQVNAGQLGDKIVLNSISDGLYGDERNFVNAKLSTDTGDVWKDDKINVEMGKTYTIHLYVHNNSPKGTAGVAEGVTTYLSLPTTVAKELVVKGYIESSNATPNRYWDEVTLVGDQDFFIEYVEGSAKYTDGTGVKSLPNEVISSTGAKIGYGNLDGKIPGCYEYSGIVTIDVKVHARVSSNVTTTVRNVTPKAGTVTGFTANGAYFVESVEAKVGDYVEYQIEYKNVSGSKVDDVMIRDVLPTNMEYVKGTTRLYNSNYQDGVLLNDDTVTTDGINIGDHEADGFSYVRFVAKVVDKKLGCNNTLTNWASATVNSKVVKDDARVFVKTDKPCETVKETPKVLPKTGATEVAGIALGAGAITTVLGLAIASRKKRM